MQYTKKTLKNGLRYIMAPMKDTETACVLVMTGVGSRHETKRLNGISHFLEHMFFKGTQKRPTPFSVVKEFDEIGAEYNAFTGKEYTGYYAKADAQHVEKTLDLIADMFLGSKIDAEEIERERGAILQEISMYEDMPRRRVAEFFEQNLYGDTPLGRDIAGPKENIQRFARREFLAYMRKGYTAQNIVVGIAGNIDTKKLEQEIRKRFAHIPSGKSIVYKGVRERQTSPQTFRHFKKTDQTHFIFGARSFGRNHKDRYILSVLATILGGGMSSRLFMEIREKRGLAYAVSIDAEAYHDVGYLGVQCGVEHGNLEKTLRVILEELKKIRTEGVSEEELVRAKEYMKGKMAMGLEGSDSVVEFLVQQETTRREIVLPEERRIHIDAVDAQEIKRVANEIFRSERMNLTVLGPHTERARGRWQKIMEEWAW